MKKFLLSLALLAGMIPAAMALTTDGQTYEEINGLQIKNMWIFDRVHTGDAYVSSPICSQRARTATMIGDRIYVGRSEETAVIVGQDTVMQSFLHIFDANNGEYLQALPLTLDGAPYSRFLGVASVGKDNFGHLWVAPMTGTSSNEVPVYMVDPETGEMTLIVEMDKGGVMLRTDYLDVLGDLTLEEAECNIMTVAGSTSDPGFPTVYRMHGDQGGDWDGGFDGDPYMDFISFYPETKTGFSLAPIVKMIIDNEVEEERYSGNLFYIDCFDTAPVTYDISGNVIDSFEYTDPALKPKVQPNGMDEFTIDGRNFFVYTIADMNNDGYGCQARICEFDESMSFEHMTGMWQIPADSLGKVNDSGLRVHCFATEKSVDDEGNEVVTLLTFKAYNGMAVYKIGKNVGGEEPPTPGVPGDVNGDDVVDGSDANIIINMILGKADPSDAADVNGDGNVDGGDLNLVINMILGK